MLELSSSALLKVMLLVLQILSLYGDSVHEKVSEESIFSEEFSCLSPGGEGWKKRVPFFSLNN